ncbi:diacylglycerol kinase family protein, partial [bacterium]|nr:diacylglycerol kinase family protein [bacterium]
TVLVIMLGFYVALSTYEWCLLMLAIMAVWTTEALNTAFEFLADVTSPEFHPLIKQAKDVAAGAVLISATGSIIIGFIIFQPKLIALL